MSRRARGERPAPRQFTVTERDRRVIHAVGRMGQATTEQLTALFFPERSVASRRLAKLVALRLLDVYATGTNVPNIYTLSTTGHELVRQQGVEAADLHRSRVGRHIDEHLRALNDVRVAFVLATRASPSVQVSAFHADLDLRRAVGKTPPAYIPDGLVELTMPHGPLVLVLEIDTGTESVSVFATKVVATVGLWQAGKKCWGAEPGTWRPVVFAPTEARARALARVINSHGGGTLWLVSDLVHARTRGVAGAAFATAADVAASSRSDTVLYPGVLIPEASGGGL